MFTGIIKGLGKIISFSQISGDCRFAIEPLFEKSSWEDGESISINGVCLSVEKHDSSGFQVYASPETLTVSNLKQLKYGSLVNLEPALRIGEKLGGHLVTGHIDCLARLEKIEPAGQSRRLRFSFPSRFGGEVIKKGSIALNGISLTVNDCGIDFLEVNIIPDSLKRTNISQWKPGSQINMETDIIGKYVLKAVTFHEDMVAGQGSVTMDLLLRNGFV